MRVEEAFGEALRKYRKDAGLSQETLAAKSGFDRSFISMLERGIRGPSLATFLHLAESLGIDPVDLLREVQHHYRP